MTSDKQHPSPTSFPWMLLHVNFRDPPSRANLAGMDGEEGINHGPPKGAASGQAACEAFAGPFQVAASGVWACITRAPGHPSGCKCTDDSCEAPASLTMPPWPDTENPSVRLGGRGPQAGRGRALSLCHGVGLAAPAHLCREKAERAQGWGGKAGSQRASVCKCPPPHTRSLGALPQTTRQHRPGATVWLL